MRSVPRATAALLALILATTLNAQPTDAPFFLFDAADETAESEVLDNPLFYDAGITFAQDRLWLAWLELVPGEGDVLWFGQRSSNQWVRHKLTDKPGDFSNPSLTFDAKGQLWMSFEAADANGKWDVFAQPLQPDNPKFSPRRISSGGGPDINHRAVADSAGGIVLIWQGDVGGRFQISAAQVTSDAIRPLAIAGGRASSWSPDIALSRHGKLYAIWDEYDGRSYNVFAQSIASAASAPFQIAASGRFEVRAKIAAGNDGTLWALWEEDGENWGKHYVARPTPGVKKSTSMTDTVGPLHRYRRLHLVRFPDDKEKSLRQYEIPQPSFSLAQNREDAPPGLKNLGAFYEGGELVVDGMNRPWIVYRHSYAPRMGIAPETHKHDNMRIYARCLMPNGWSGLYTFNEGQGDAMQRISVAPLSDGIALAWDTGRTDRRKNVQGPRGVALAEIRLSDTRSAIPARTTERPMETNTAREIASRQRPRTTLGGTQYELFYGDLHRHTDISLCFSPADGSIEDAYRYAIDTAPLDFLGITDHTHDLEMGEPLTQIWWRSRKEADRHQLASTFIPFYAYERSRGDTDHNVISLRSNVLRPHTYPLSAFWNELDTNTFTIPHQPFNAATWKQRNDALRPLLEIYQGFRNDAREANANEALGRGHKLGFIASSDHLSTAASFACVWAEKPTRESVFRAMQARRTFAATSKIVLKVTCGEHWMGESFSLKSALPIRVEARGTAAIRRIEMFVNGESVGTWDGNAARADWSYQPKANLSGPHTFYVRVEQEDGNRAWSSPLWIDFRP